MNSNGTPAHLEQHAAGGQLSQDAAQRPQVDLQAVGKEQPFCGVGHDAVASKKIRRAALRRRAAALFAPSTGCDAALHANRKCRPTLWS